MDCSDLTFGEQDIARLFCHPQILVDLIEACLSGKSTQVLAEIVLRDAALAARVLQAASKSNGKPLDAMEPVTCALQMLGVPVLTGIALQAARQIVAEDFSAAELAYVNGLWFSSQVAGRVARCLSPTVSYLHVEEAQLSGLLLNLGMHALFARHGADYVELAVEPFCSADLCQREQGQLKVDHLRVAEMLIGPWQLDSFLLDAIRFLHTDVSQVESCGLLLKISRLAQQFCLQPGELTAATEALAERLFQFSQSEIDYLFTWAHGLYQGQMPALDDSVQLQADLKSARSRLVDLIFSLADQDSARARLAGKNHPQTLVCEARALYQENSAATEAVFLLVDNKHNQVSGIVAPGQSRLISELRIPLEASTSLVAQALVKGEPVSSFATVQPLSVTDQLLQRICTGRGFLCRPFLLDGRMLGAVVLGIETEQQLPEFTGLRLRMFDQVVSETLAQLSSADQDRLSEGSTLLRRVTHELSNPLTIISNYAEVLQHLLADDDNRELPESIKREVRRIDEVLNYYLNQQELPRFPDQSVNLNQLVHEAISAVQDSDLHPRQIEVKLALQDDLGKVPTNGVLVKQVLVNLLKNAAEALESGGIIRLSTRDSYCSNGGRFAEVVVEDNGAGIDLQLQNKLFRPVVSTKGVGHAGVGLSIVKGMVDDLGGRISYHCSAAVGTGFHLQLPCADDVLPLTEQP